MHPSIPIYQPVEENDNIHMEYTDLNIILAHELVHSLKALEGNHKSTPRNDNLLSNKTYPGKILDRMGKVRLLFKIRKKIINGESLDVNLYDENFLPEIFDKNGNIVTKEKLNDNILTLIYSSIDRFNDDLCTHNHYNTQTKKTETIALYKEEAIVTYGTTGLKSIKGEDIFYDKNESKISDNQLRNEMELPARVNYINNPKNQFYFKQAVSFANLVKDEEFKEKLLYSDETYLPSFLTDKRTFELDDESSYYKKN